MIHSFNIKLATNFGIEKAIIIHSLYFWVCKNAANDTHLHDDRYWTYNSAKSLSLLFPYMSAKKIWRVVDDLIKDDILIKGWFNESPFNRTAWHTFSDNGLSILVDSGYDISNLISKLSTFQKWKFSNSKNGNSQIPKMENVNSIYNNNSISNNTDIYTDIYTDNNIKEKEKEKEKDCWLWNENSDKGEHLKSQNNDNPFNLSDEMIEIVNEWKAYKKERRQSYTPKGEIMFIRKLLKLSNGSTELARQIVEDAMANNYQGIFPLKNQQQRSKCDATGAVINVNDAWNNG